MQPTASPDLRIPEAETCEDAVMSLMMALGRRLRQRQPGDVIDYSAFPILKLLCRQGPSRLSSIAHVLGLDASTVSRHVKQLEDRGLLGRTDDPDDRRASRVDISELGRSTLDEAFALRRQVISAALDDWSAQERDTFQGLVQRLVESLVVPLEQVEPDPADPASPRTTPGPVSA
jgi:DNA-binding MarR family transcriptional regulator